MSSRRSDPAVTAATPGAGEHARMRAVADLLQDLAAPPPNATGDSFSSQTSDEFDWLRDEEAQAAAAARAELAALQARVGSRVGPYRLTELLGRGGMGAVFAAERDDGSFSQQVALKLIRAGGSDGTRLANRFRRERAILARLEHPHVARLLDGGVSEAGEPWFAMEHVHGLALHTYCETHRPTLGQRIELFLQICDAVAYAHRNLIVHRDLKPANVLVDEQDQAKLLDFGIAKLLDRVRNDTVLTRAEERVLTPDYAAPEQILGQPVTTATDVYALGLLLFELLTGRRAQDLSGKSLLEAERWVVNRDITRPSAVAGAPARALRGDLDAIVSKALRKEPAERYDSAQALAEDLRRHLERRAVLARGGAFSYRARTFVRRHRWPLAAAGGIVLALLTGLALALWQAREAQLQAQRAEGVKTFVLDIFRGIDPRVVREGGRAITADEVVDAGVKRLHEQTDLQAEDRVTLMLSMASLNRSIGRNKHAANLIEEAYVLSRAEWGPDDPRRLPALAAQVANGFSNDTLETTDSLVAEGERLVELARPGAYVRERAALLRTKMRVANRRGDYARATEVARQHLALLQRHYGEEAPETTSGWINLGWTLSWQDRYDEAEAMFLRALASDAPPLDDRLTDTDLDISRNMIHMHLGNLNSYRGRYREGQQEYQRGVDTATAELGATHPVVRYFQSEVLFLEARLGPVAAILPRWEAGRKEFELNPTAQWVFNDWRHARLLLWLGRVAEAEPVIRRYVAAQDQTSGPQSKLTQFGKRDLGLILIERGALEEAETVLSSAMQELERIGGESNYQRALAEAGLARVRLARGAPEQAERHARHAWVILRDFLGPQIDETARAQHELGRALVALRRSEEGIPHLRTAADIYTAQYSENDVRSAEFRFVLGEALLPQQPAQAHALLDAAARILVDAPGNTLPVRERAERWLAGRSKS